MPSRTLTPNTSVVKTHPVGTPDLINNIGNIKAISTDAVEFWGDNAIWDTTTNLPVSVDKFNITGTPRKRA